MSDNGWSAERSAKLYQVEGWGAGYFQVNEQGHVEAITDGVRSIDLKKLCDELAGRDLWPPLLLRFSDMLIDELNWANHILLTTPMYNFSVPATLKAWIDLVCRAGVTFSYDEDGPMGLLSYKSAEVIVTTGGVPLGSDEDFVSGYLRQVFSFIGIDDIDIIGADRMNIDAEDSLARAFVTLPLSSTKSSSRNLRRPCAWSSKLKYASC